jgi:hypothetical protein
MNLFLLKVITVFITLYRLGACEAYTLCDVPPRLKGIITLARAAGVNVDDRGFIIKNSHADRESEVPSHAIETIALPPKILDGVYFRDAAAYEETKRRVGEIEGSCLLVCHNSSYQIIARCRWYACRTRTLSYY